jgi:alpha-L-arabinofuranosidase
MIQINFQIPENKISYINGKILTAEKINTHNTFNNPDAVRLENFNGYEIINDCVLINLQAKSVAVFEIKI